LHDTDDVGVGKVIRGKARNIGGDKNTSGTGRNSEIDLE
jgi:hypothetical protein